MAQPNSDDKDWLKASAQAQRAGDQDVLKVLREGVKALDQQIAALRGASFSEGIRREQILTVKRTLLREQAKIMRATGKIAQARRLEAAARAVKLGSLIDAQLFKTAGLPSRFASELEASLTRGLESTLDVALARLNGPQIPLSQRVYNVDVWLGGRVQAMVNSALITGLSAREFAAKARDWINPNTPGGVRYASMRLARTEINNAFHAISVQNGIDKPWINSQRWNLSGSHGRADKCDVYAKQENGDLGAGLYLPEDVPSKPHPQCLCYITPEVEDTDSFLTALIGGKYDAYLHSRVPGLAR